MIREYDLSGRLAVVTGGAAGIGRAISEVLAEGGATVVVADRDEAAALSLAEQLNGQALRLDVTDAEALSRAVAALRGRLGPITDLIHAAGVVDDAPMLAKSTAGIEDVLIIDSSGKSAIGDHFDRLAVQ